MSDKPDLLLLAAFGPAFEALLEQAYTVHRLHDAPDAHALLDEVGPRIRAAVGYGGRGLSGAEIARLPKLEITALFGVGLDTMDMAAARARGIVVTDTPQVTADVADTTLALYLAAVRRVIEADAWVRDGRWEAGRMPPPHRASGRKVGVFGMGRIGKAIADRFAPLAAEIAYTTRRPAPGVVWRHEPDVKALAAWCDVLVLAAAGGEETRHAVDAVVLDALGPRGVLVNIARGSLVDEDALVAALRDGRIAGAGLDVFEDEPHVRADLRALKTAVLSPHAGGASREGYAELAAAVLENLAAHFAGRPVPSPVR